MSNPTNNLDASIAQWVNAGWQVESRTDTQAVMVSTTKVNHVMYGLVMAGLVLIGGPAAFCVGLGGAYGEVEKGASSEDAGLALWMVIGVWLIVVALVGYSWARAAKPTVKRSVLMLADDGRVKLG
jgi:hypothetical protein